MTADQTFRSRIASSTKIVATIGPACRSEARLRDLILAGVDVFRINMAHASRAEHQGSLEMVRSASREAGHPVAVLADLAGPKIRLGELPGGQVQCAHGDRLRFVRGDGPADPGQLTTTYAPLIDELSVDDRVMLADGTVGLVVRQRGPDYADCEVTQPGLLRSRQGVNLPGVKLSAPALGEADRQNALWAAGSGVDFLGLSFVRQAEDVRQLKALIAGVEGLPSAPQVIAKIEKPEALDHLEEIVRAADGVMVARGDLGVETDIARMAVAQKRIIATCHRLRRPVIIATQMLDSMQHSRVPTRAEATDVANAVLDGADACMLSGETAVGEYPCEAVEMMHRIALATEPLLRERPPLARPHLADEGIDPVTEATAYAAGRLADDLAARTVVVASATGETALSLSKNRNFVPTVGASNSEATVRRMCLYWGVIPLAGAPVQNSAELLEYVVQRGQAVGALKSGDRIVLLTGSDVTGRTHNMIQVHVVP
jgi:pyruvate kinase